MKKNTNKQHNKEHKPEVEILKAVAQAWHEHSSNSKPTNEHEAYRHEFRCKPSRFKLEAMNKLCVTSGNWDFKKSLWDSYEIVTVSKRLERGMVLDNPFSPGWLVDQTRVHRRRRESKNSLRNLFNLMSSRRFNQSVIPQENTTTF